MAYEFKHCGIEFEDLVSICLLGLVKAASRFDEKYGAAFSTFAVPVMRNEILQELRRMRRRNAAICISLDAEVENSGLVAEMIPDQKDLFSGIYASDMCRECMEILTDKEKKIVIPLILGDETQEQVGVRMGLSQSYVSRTYKSVKEKLKRIV